MPNKLTKAQFATKLRKGEFPELEASLDNPLELLRGAETIEPDPSGERAHNTLLGQIVSFLVPATDPAYQPDFTDVALAGLPFLGKIGRLVKSGLGLKSASPNLKRAAQDILKILEAAPEGEKGFTYNLFRGNLARTPSYAISTFKAQERPVAQMTKKEIIQYLQDHLKTLSDPSQRYSVGGWQNTLDLVETPEKLKMTLAEAKRLGDVHKQKAIFDLESLQDIPLMYQVEHRGKAGLTELNPKFYGTGQPGAEKVRRSDPDWKDRVYVTKKGSPFEGRFRGLPVSEGEIRASDVYSIPEDPTGLIEKANTLGKGQGNVRIFTIFEKLAREAGFKGLEDGKGTIAYFDTLPVKPRP